MKAWFAMEAWFRRKSEPPAERREGELVAWLRRAGRALVSASLPAPFYRLVLLWIFGIAVLGVLSMACFAAGLNFAPAAFALLIAIVLLSLLDSLISSVVFSVCLLYTSDAADE